MNNAQASNWLMGGFRHSVRLGALCTALYLFLPTPSLAQGFSGAGGFLGVGLASASENGRLLRNLGAGSGAVVTSILQGSAAEAAGIRAGDIIVRINSTYINTSVDFLACMARIQPGSLVLVSVLRQGRLIKFMGFAQRRPDVAPPEVGATAGPQMFVGTARCPVATISGNWSGVEVTDRLQGIDVSFKFNTDGTYDYFAGQGNAPWITQRGAFEISDTGDQRYPCKISLTPDSATVQIASPAHLFVVQSRDLMDDKPRTFMYKFFPTATHLMLAGIWTDWHNDIGTVGLDRR